MGEKLVIGPIKGGLSKRVEQFNINNDSFPVLINAYQWRDRVKRKRGTGLLTRLMRYFDSTNTAYSTNSTLATVADEGNLLTGYNSGTILDLKNGSIVPGSVTLTETGTGEVFTDSAMDGTLSGDMGGSGTINYNSGVFTLTGFGAVNVEAQFRYYPLLPVMGLRDLILEESSPAENISFDTTYSYEIQDTNPYYARDVTFYKNSETGLYTGYTRKTVSTPFRWTGQDYQNFYTVNYEGALWATNGISVPFNSSLLGMQFRAIEGYGGFVAGPPATLTINITGHGLVVGDFVFINETNETAVNFQTGYVTTVNTANQVTVTFPNATFTAAPAVNGILQYLTNTADTTRDCLRYYTGDPTDGNALSPTLSGFEGWVNFCPPLSEQNFSVAGKQAAQYYLVGARLIQPFKDRLLFFGPVIQTSTGAPIFLQDSVIYSQNGTPYYTCSFTGDIDSATTVFNHLLVPKNTTTQLEQTATANAWFEDSVGYGGFVSAGIDETITSIEKNEDVIITGFTETQSRLVYTSNDILPFNFYTIDSVLGTSSPFSTINLGTSVLSRGKRGFVQTTQQVAQRFDEEIPDEVYQMDLTNNGPERIVAVRDYINEWLFFSYVSNQNTIRFPTRTLFYNYIDQTWAQFQECYTAYGTFRRRTGRTWATIGEEYETWSVWNTPWNSGISTLLQPQVIAGTPNGYVLTRGSETGEAKSIEIKNISFAVSITGITNALQAVVTAANTFVAGEEVTFSDVTGMTQINGQTGTIVSATSSQFTVNIDSQLYGVYAGSGTATPTNVIYCPDHCLEDTSSLPNYIIISDALGTISSQVNDKVFRVVNANQNGFDLDPSITSGTYLGKGQITRCYVPFIQSKQFPVAWGFGRKTRLGVQQYLFTTTATGQVQLLLYKSQNNDDPYNDGAIIPAQTSNNDSLIYSAVLYTCQEGTNIGLTEANRNLQQMGSNGAAQIWHRKNTSLIGDTVQFAITLSDEQMRDVNRYLQFAEIEFHGAILDVTPSQVLS